MEEYVTFDEGEHLRVRDVSCLQVDLQSQQQSEEQFVFLIETSGCVTVHLREGQTGSRLHLHIVHLIKFIITLALISTVKLETH